jgi:putative lipoprotein
MQYIQIFLLLATFSASASGNPLQSTEAKKISTEVNDGKINGTVISPGHIEIPEGAIVTVLFSDISLQDVSAKTLAQQIIANARTFPVEFTISYDPELIQRGRRYAVSARIEQNGKLLFINDTVIPVLSFDLLSKDVILPVIPLPRREN